MDNLITLVVQRVKYEKCSFILSAWAFENLFKNRGCNYYLDDDGEIAKYALKFYGNILSVNLTCIPLLQVTEWLCGYSDIKQEKRYTCSSAPSVKLRGISSVQ